jgi:hypothetical protein
MVLFFSRNKYHFKGCVLYFGCIKYSCFMCAHFLRAYGIISTRGCHGRLFKRWTVPEAASLEAGQAERKHRLSAEAVSLIGTTLAYRDGRES